MKPDPKRLHGLHARTEAARRDCIASSQSIQARAAEEHDRANQDLETFQDDPDQYVRALQRRARARQLQTLARADEARMTVA